MDGPASTGEVVSIGARGKYRPDYARLACSQVAAARRKLCMSAGDFAAYLGDQLGWRVAPQTVERWEDDAIPPGDVVLASASVEPQVTGAPEAVTPYAGRGDVSRDQWNGIISGAERHLWLYGMAEYGYATDDDVPEILAAAVGAGCDVRVLLLSPDYPGMGAINAGERHPGGTLIMRIRASLAKFSWMRDEIGPQVKIRTYDTHPAVSIVRGDGHLIVTPYIRFLIGGNSPTFEFTEESARKMFGRYSRHFDGMWNLATDWTSHESEQRHRRHAGRPADRNGSVCSGT